LLAGVGVAMEQAHRLYIEKPVGVEVLVVLELVRDYP
jgi:hypothetical protein